MRRIEFKWFNFSTLDTSCRILGVYVWLKVSENLEINSHNAHGFWRYIIVGNSVTHLAIDWAINRIRCITFLRMVYWIVIDCQPWKKTHRVFHIKMILVLMVTPSLFSHLASSHWQIFERSFVLVYFWTSVLNDDENNVTFHSKKPRYKPNAVPVERIRIQNSWNMKRIISYHMETDTCAYCFSNTVDLSCPNLRVLEYASDICSGDWSGLLSHTIECAVGFKQWVKKG